MSPFKRQHLTTPLPEEIRAKWSEGVLKEGFTPIPKKLIRTLHILFPKNETTEELSALLAIVDFRRPRLLREPSPAYLAFVAGLKEEEFLAAVRRLIKRGYLTAKASKEAIEVDLSELYRNIEEACEEQDKQEGEDIFGLTAP